VVARDDLSNFVEVAGPDETLVGDGSVADFLSRELFLLELSVAVMSSWAYPHARWNIAILSEWKPASVTN
jgi:hypothetical protein